MTATAPVTNEAIERLRRTEARARAIMMEREANERRWDRQYEAARKTPEWKAYCEATGSCDRYNYGDVIC